MIRGKRIALIGCYKPQVGGGSHHVQGLVNYLKKQNKIYVVNMWDPGNPILGHWCDNGAEIYQEKILVPVKPGIQTIIQKTKRSLLLKKKIDLYHAHSVYDALIGFIDQKKPLVLTLHGYSSLEPISKGIFRENSLQFKIIRMIEKKSVERANAIITVGKNLKNWVINELEADPEKVFYIPNGVEVKKVNLYSTEDLKKFREKNNIKNKRLILFIKAFTEQNGILTLINALPQVIKEHANIHLVAIGGGPLKNKVISLSKRLDLHSNISFIDRIPNEQIHVYLDNAEIFAVPFIPIYNFGGQVSGVGDTLGIAHLEAMAAGIPVISTAIGNISKLQEEMNNSLLYVPPNDPESLAEAIICLLDDPKNAKKIGNKAKKLVKEKYSWDKIAKQTSAAYQYALEK